MFDNPRLIGIPRGDEIAAAEWALRPRAALLALADDLADIGVRARLVDHDDALLRCWDPRRMGKSVTVACLRGPDDRVTFRYHPSGNELGDAEAPLEQGTVAGQDIARAIAVALAFKTGASR